VGFIERAYGLRPGLLDLVVSQESAGHPRARSPKGARGLMQVMPATAARLGVASERLEDPLVNLATGAAELRRLEVRFNGDLRLALAGYNAGEAAVVRHGGRIPPYPETRAYVSAILQRLAGRATGGCALGRRS
jgi:soluble lytic murein transglycosylase-like protein